MDSNSKNGIGGGSVEPKIIKLNTQELSEDGSWLKL